MALSPSSPSVAACASLSRRYASMPGIQRLQAAEELEKKYGVSATVADARWEPETDV